MVVKKAPTPKRGDIYLVNFDPTLGSEIRKGNVLNVLFLIKKSVEIEIQLY
jgi:hypothetical protein